MLSLTKYHRKEFLKLFKIAKTKNKTNFVSYDDIIKALSLPHDFNEWEYLLKSFNKSKYFELTDNGIIRNNKKTPYQKIVAALKTSGKWAVKTSVPIAISIATGGVGLGILVAPLVNRLVNYFENIGISLPDDINEDIISMISSSEAKVVDELIDKIFEKNKSNKGSIQEQEHLKNQIILGIQDVIYPFINELNATLQELKGKQDHFEDIFEEWTVEQENILDNMTNLSEKTFNITKSILQTLDEKFMECLSSYSNQLANMENGIIKANAEIGKVIANQNLLEKKLDKIFCGLCKEKLSDLELNELFQVSKLQLKKIRLHGKFEKYPFDPSLYVPDNDLEKVFDNFLDYKAKPLFLMLATMGMGKT